MLVEQSFPDSKVGCLLFHAYPGEGRAWRWQHSLVSQASYFVAGGSEVLAHRFQLDGQLDQPGRRCWWGEGAATLVGW